LHNKKEVAAADAEVQALEGLSGVNSDNGSSKNLKSLFKTETVYRLQRTKAFVRQQAVSSVVDLPESTPLHRPAFYSEQTPNLKQTCASSVSHVDANYDMMNPELSTNVQNLHTSVLQKYFIQRLHCHHMSNKQISHLNFQN